MEAFDHRARARGALNGTWVTAVLVGLIASLLGGSGTAGSLNLDIELDQETIHFIAKHLDPAVVAAVTTVLGFLVLILAVYALVAAVIGGPVRLGYIRYNLNLIDGKDGEFSDLFSQFSRFWDAFVLNLLINLFITLWSLLFIIPGIVASYSYAMAPYILLEDPDCTPMEAIRRSKEMMDGNKGDLLTLGLSFIGWRLLSLLTLGLGDLLLVPYIAASQASFYRYVSQGWSIPRIEDISNP